MIGLFEEFLGDLDGVEGGAFEELVAADPEAEAVVEGAVEAEAADGAVVVFGEVEGKGVLGLGRFVDDIEAGGLAEGVEGGGEGDGALELGADGDGVGAVDGDADAGDAGFEGGVVHDFASFVLHFHFLLGVAIGEEGIDVGKDVKGDLVGIDFAGDGLASHDLADLAFEFLDGLGAGAGDGLVAGGENAGAVEGLVEGVKGHEGDGRGAVGVGDDAVVLGDVGGVDLGDDEGDVGVHAEGAGVIDDDATGLGGEGCELAGDAAAGAKEGDIDAGERVRFEFLDGDCLSLEGEGFADRTGGGQEGELAKGEATPFERLDHLEADGARCTDDCHVRIAIHKGRVMIVVRQVMSIRRAQQAAILILKERVPLSPSPRPAIAIQAKSHHEPTTNLSPYRSPDTLNLSLCPPQVPQGAEGGQSR